MMNTSPAEPSEMKSIVRQLEQVRRTARSLLALRGAARFISAAILAALACALMDYALRLPSWLRLGMDVILLVAVARYLASQGARVWSFAPSLSELALRAERQFAPLSGALASGVEFTLHAADESWPPRTAALAHASVQDARQRAQDVPLRRMIDARGPVRDTAAALGLLLLLATTVWAMPDQAALAARRWFMPLSDAQWPRRTHIQSTVAVAIWPSDTPLQLTAAIERGLRRDMRAWVVYRIRDDADRPIDNWHWLLMNQQSDNQTPREGGQFERLLDIPALMGDAESAAMPQSVEFYFSAGDDQTEPQSVLLVSRPALRSVSVHIEPPDYARGLLGPQTIGLHEQSGPVAAASAREGSAIRWTLRLNKPIPAENIALESLLPNLTAVEGAVVQYDAMATDDPHIIVAFILRQSLESTIRLTDEHGLSNLSERLYRLTVIEDQPPAALLTEPQTDEAVLATAVIPVEAVAQDDVAVESLLIECHYPEHGSLAEGQTMARQVLAQSTGRTASLSARHSLELSALKLQPGDQVQLTAVARDVFDLDGRRHEPVRSPPRILRVIDTAQLITQIHSELAGVRQRAIRLEAQQQEITRAEVRQAEAAQDQLTSRISSQAALVEALTQRAERNQLSASALEQLLAQARQLLEEARAASSDAQGELDQALRDPAQSRESLEQAKAAQAQVSQKLTDLVQRLDQGRDALTLQLQLQQLAAMQEELALDARELLPRTLGKSPDQLSEAEQRELAAVAERQAALAQRAREMAQQMRATAESLSQPGATDQELAAAEALAAAAATAQRQGLDRMMDQAAQAARQNQLASAGQQQNRSIEVMRDMLGQMAQQDRRQREILRRRLQELQQAIEKLVAIQKAQLQRLDEAVSLKGLDEGMDALRRNTLATADQAMASPKAQATAQELSGAARQQSEAVMALRQDEKDPAADAERQSLRHLEAALSLVKQTAEAQRQEELRQTRGQLRQVYEELAARQEELRQQTAPFTEIDMPNRQQRAQIVDLGHREGDLRVAFGDAIKDSDAPPLFDLLHQRIDRLAGEAVTALRGGSASLEVLDQQKSIASLLRQLALALEEAQQQEPFESGASSAEGGGGGGEQGAGQLIPPAAQLKLVRGLQETVYQRTRGLAPGSVPDSDAAQRQRALRQLAVDQRELAGMSESLIRQMEQQQRPAIEPGGEMP